MKKNLLLLVLMLVWVGLNGEKLSVLSDLINPSIMMGDQEKIYILDGYQVYVYSQTNYKLLYKFGKKGEGPGELLTQPDLPLTMSLSNKKIIVNSFNKMVYFSKKGEYLKEIKLPFLAFQILPLENNFVASQFIRNSDGSGTLKVNLFDKELKLLKNIYTVKLLNDQGKGKIALPLLSTHLSYSNKKLYLVDQLKNFQIEIYDSNGNKKKTIKKKYHQIKIDEKYKKEKMAWLKLQPAFKTAPDRIRNMVYFLDYLPAINHFLVSDQKIYIQTSKMNKSKAEFIILKENGETEKTLMLPNAKIESIRPTLAANYFFVNDNYFYLSDNDDEWELHKIKL